MITQTQQMSPGKGIPGCKKICLKELSNIPLSLGWPAVFMRPRPLSCLGLFLVLPKGVFAFFPFSNLHSHPIPPLETQTGAGLLEVACSLTTVGLRKLRELFPAPDSLYTHTFLA